MFCTKCGKELYDDDKFCAHCGAGVREPKHAKYDEVVFNPPFKIEAEKRTQEILKTTEDPKTTAKVGDSLSFDWNLEGFPSSQPRKTETVDFNWDSIIEKRKATNSISVEKIQPVPAKEPKPPVNHAETAAETETEQEESPLSIEELERELFGIKDDSDVEKPGKRNLEPTIIVDADTRKKRAVEHVLAGDERFYTYNQKFNAFQELLDEERERLRNLEESYNREKEAMIYTLTGEPFRESDKAAMKTHLADEPEGKNKLTRRCEEPPQPKESQMTKSPEMETVVVPAETITIDLSEEGATGDKGTSKTVRKGGAGKEPSPHLYKLRYSDVFPDGLVNDDGTGHSDDSKIGKEIKSKSKSLDAIYDDVDDEEEPEKGHIFAKIIIIILIILIIIEGGVVAIKFIAPESNISLWANEVMIKAMDLLTGNDSREWGRSWANYKQ